MNVNDFILARVAEDEDVARSAWPARARLLRECEGYRAILEGCVDTCTLDGCDNDMARSVIAALARIWLNHPDYDPKWSDMDAETLADCPDGQ